ncbi:MAG: hypothetical protein ABEJ95_02470 [Candidatus Nanohalobium sp.]
MAVNISDAVKNTFGSLKTGVGKKLVGVFFLIQLLNLGATYLTGLEGSLLTMLGGLGSVIVGLAGIVVTIGGLRSFRSGELEKDNFTDNLVWPIIRITGVNVVTAVFAYAAAAVFIIPAIMSIFGGATGATSGLSALSSIGVTDLLLGLAGGVLGIAAAAYVTVTLLLAQPLIAIDNRRMFQALDESVQRTRGNKISILLTGIAVTAVYLVALLAVSGATALINPAASTAAAQLIVAPVFGPLFLSLLNYFSEELPEK